MACKDRLGNILKSNDGQDKLIRKLYYSRWGRGVLKVVTKPFFSNLGGWYMNTRLSKRKIPSFIRNNDISMADYVPTDYKSFNAFFIREILPGKRVFDTAPEAFCAPCDSKLTVYEVDAESRFNIKDTEYTFQALTRNEELARTFDGGYLLVFRLSVEDYHRYYYMDAAEKTENIVIDGCYHTVNPIATNLLPVYQENQREYCLLHTENFGTVLMMEVGAMLVGKIVNYDGPSHVVRGQEKGRFEFGGSTVILAVQAGRVCLDEDILRNSLEGFETKVRLGERIGSKI